ALGSDAASGAGVALRLVESQEVPLSDVYWQQYEATRDAQAYAAAYAAYLRAFTEPSLFGTAGPAQHAPGAASLADVFYQRVQERIAAEPARAVSHWRILLLRAARPLAAWDGRRGPAFRGRMGASTWYVDLAPRVCRLESAESIAREAGDGTGAPAAGRPGKLDAVLSRRQGGQHGVRRGTGLPRRAGAD